MRARANRSLAPGQIDHCHALAAAAKRAKLLRLQIGRQSRLVWLKEDFLPETGGPDVLSQHPSKGGWPLPEYAPQREQAAGWRCWCTRLTEPRRPAPIGWSTARKIPHDRERLPIAPAGHERADSAHP